MHLGGAEECFTVVFFHLLQVHLDLLIMALLKAIRLLKTLMMFESTCSFHIAHMMYSESKCDDASHS